MMIIIIMMIKSIIATLLYLVCPSAVLLKLAFNAPLYWALGTETSYFFWHWNKFYKCFCTELSFQIFGLKHGIFHIVLSSPLFTEFFTLKNDIFPESFALSLSLSLSSRRCFQQRTLTFPKFVNFKRLLMLTTIHFTEPLLQIPEAISNSNWKF